MSVAYNEVKAIVAGIADRNYDRVYVGITGATNPIVASLFQATMAYLSSEVIPIYVQGRGTLSVRSFVASDVRDRVVAEEALSVARSGQIRVAARLAERLKSEEDWQFLASSLNALALWDDFDYEQAHKGLDPLEHRAAVLRSHPLLAAVAETTSRLAEAAGKMFALAKDIRNDQKFAETVGKPDWRSTVRETGPLLVADALANAQRRVAEGRYTDAVLRAYRAAECATQMRLLAIGIHPQRPDACQPAFRRFSSEEVTKGSLAFKAGLVFLAAAGQLDFAPIEDKVRDLGSLRNSTYLEHGYVRVQEAKGRKCVESSCSICEYLLDPGIGELSRRFEMRF
jgi:hypothetical protein